MTPPTLQPGDLVETVVWDRYWADHFTIRARVLRSFKNGRVRIEDVDQGGCYSADPGACRVLRRAARPAPATETAA